MLRYIFDVPAPAYTLLIHYLALDHTFCNYFVPVFRTSQIDGLRLLTSVALYLKEDASDPNGHPSTGDAILVKDNIEDDDVLDVLRLWHFKQNGHRANLIPKGSEAEATSSQCNSKRFCQRFHRYVWHCEKTS